MSKITTMCENDLAVLAKTFRRQASTTRAQAARDMKVSQTSIFNAEETPDQSLVKLRMRMIETHSKFKVRGPVYFAGRKIMLPFRRKRGSCTYSLEEWVCVAQFLGPKVSLFEL